MTVTSDTDVAESYARDASGLRRVPEGVARPSTVDELIAVARDALAGVTSVTMAGGQTSTTGASITDRGLLISTRALNRVLEIDRERKFARVEPGVVLSDLNRVVAGDQLLFPPDPTSEFECTIGGSIACNASGSRTLRYGPTRTYVRALRILLADGTITEIRRQAHEKNTAGYWSVQEPVDWFVGSEGTLGILLEAEVTLIDRPARTIGIAVPFAHPRSALRFVVEARESGLNPQCLEYFDKESVSIVRKASELLSRWAPDAEATVYTEATTDGDEPDYTAWIALAEKCGATADDIQVFDGDTAVHEARRLRHAVPAEMHERVSKYLATGGRRVSTDWAVPYRRAADALDVAAANAERFGVKPVTYGHLGNGHPHQNFAALTPDDVERCEKAVEATLREIVRMDGTVAAEHGIGKLKRRWLPLQLSPLQHRVMRALKTELDPRGLLAPGNLWD